MSESSENPEDGEFSGPSNDLGYASIENLSDEWLDFSTNFGSPLDFEIYHNTLFLDCDLEEAISVPLRELMINLNKLIIDKIADKRVREEVMGLIKQVNKYNALRVARHYEHSARVVRAELAREAATRQSNDEKAISFRIFNDYLELKGTRPKLKDVSEKIDAERSAKGMSKDPMMHKMKRHYTEWRKLKSSDENPDHSLNMEDD